MKHVDGGLLVFALLLFLHESLQQTCPPAPSHLSLASTPCGLSNLARDGATDVEARQLSAASPNWFVRAWNGFLSVLAGGLRQGDPLIINGAPASISEAPFMAHLSVDFSSGTSSSCSASIIGDQWILTAAHCITRAGNKGTTLASKVTVRVGNADRTAGSGISSTSFKYHSNFDRSNLRKGYDIALIRLPTSLAFGPTVQPICYPTSDDLGTAAAACDKKAYGWGVLSIKDYLKRRTSRTLQKLDVTVSDRAARDCSAVDGIHVCVWGTPSSSGPCNGDSGGPLVVRYGDQAYEAGLLSGSVSTKDKCTGRFYYTRTSAFADW
ncbi:unnamed protein product, partial [Darwinula stevensoni]